MNAQVRRPAPACWCPACAPSCILPPPGAPKPKSSTSTLPRAGVEAEVEADAQRAVRVVLGVEPAERRLHLQRGERVGEVGVDRARRRPTSVRPSIFRPPPATTAVSASPACVEAGVQLDAGDRRLAVDAGEEALADQLACGRCRASVEVQEDVVGPLLRGRDARRCRRDRTAARSRPGCAASRRPRPAPARRRSRRSGASGSTAVLLQRRARVRVPQLQPPRRPGSRRSRSGRRARRRRSRRTMPGPFGLRVRAAAAAAAFLGASAARNPMPSLFFIAANRHERHRHAQVVDREAAARSACAASPSRPGGGRRARPSPRGRRCAARRR